jgi:hypothetical protein
VGGPANPVESGNPATSSETSGEATPVSSPGVTDSGNVASQANDIAVNLGNEGISVPPSEVESFLTTLEPDVLESDLLVFYVLSQFDTAPIVQTPRVVNASTSNEVILIDMSTVKAELAPVLNWSGSGGESAAQAYAAIKDAVSIVASPQFVQAHYAKNVEMYSNPPQTVTAIQSGEFGNPSDWRPTSTPEGNVSYVYVGNDEQYKGYNYVFDNGGNLVTDPATMGTYNVVDPEANVSDHVWNDILPWILLGNSTNDTTTPEQRIEAAIASYPQLLSEIGAEQLKLIVFSYQQLTSKSSAPNNRMVGA